MTARLVKVCQSGLLTVTLLMAAGFQYLVEGETFQAHLVSSPILTSVADPSS